jgi:hypothetical protein
MRGLTDVEAVIDRRLLLNFRVDPDVAARLVPPPFRPNVSTGVAIAGICLIRLIELRPRGVPRGLGITTESAAHRFAVEWDSDDGGQNGHGVFIPRRETNSRLSVLLGGRAFPGEHHRARFDVTETEDRYDITLRSVDGRNRVSVRAHRHDEMPDDSIFVDIDEASDFFRRDALGYSPTREPDRYDGLELQAAHWHIDPLAVDDVASTFFDDRSVFPAGSVEFDCALSMRRTQARWRSQPHARRTATSPVSS